MANGLRKLIKNAQRSVKTTGRINRFGTRLRVEELEERIAPAAVSLVAGELIAWDTAAGGTGEAIDAGDGFLGIGNNTTAGITVQVEDVTFAVGNDTATLNLTITADTAGAADKTIHIVTNQVLGNVSLNGLDAATTGVTLLIESGFDPAAAVGNVVTIDVDGTAATATQTAANIAEANGPGAVGATDFAAVANAGMGAITMPAVSGTNIPVAVHLITNGTGAIGAITSADADLDLTDDAADSLIDTGSLGAFSWAGDVLPDANGITFNVDDNAGTGIASLSFGSVNVAGAGSLAISAEGIGTTTIGTGGITISSTGGVTIDPDIAGADDTLSGFTSAGLISNTAGSTGAIVIGDAAVTAGAVSLAGITVASTNDAADVAFQGTSIGGITSSAAIQTAAGAAGDIAFTAGGATGTMGAVNVVAGGIVAGTAGADISFSASDGMGAISVTGNVGGAGAISFAADTGGTADSGDIPSVTVNGAVGDGTGAVAFSGNQLTGATHVTGNMASAGAVTFTFNDGIGNVAVDGNTAQGANVTFAANADGADDAGTMGTLTSQSLGDASDGTGVVTINTNGGAADNTTVRPVGAISAEDGNAHLNITADGDVALITVSGGDGSNGNELTLDNLNLNASGDPTNSPNVVGITLPDIAGENELLTLTAGGTFVIPGTLGPIVCGGSDAGDVVDINNNNVQIFAGDDPSNGFGVVYTATVDSKVDITCGFFQSDGGTTGTIQANTRAASDIFTLTEGTNVTRVTVASDVTADVLFDPNGGNDDEGVDVEPSFTIADLAGTSSNDDLEIISEDGTDVDVLSILPATDGNVDVDTIVIGGDLLGDIGDGTYSFDAVKLIIIQGTDGANDFFGNSLQGYASQTGTLGLAGVDVLLLDTPNDGTQDIEILSGVAGSIFMFADAAGADNAVDQFNHHVAVAGGLAGASAILRGVDGDGTVNEFQLGGDGVSGQPIDPADVFADTDYAMISYIILEDVGGLSTDVSVREVAGSTNGSFLEFETNVGLVNLTTQLDSISVGIDDGGDLVDNWIETYNAGGADWTGDDFDRLGGGVYGQSKAGLDPDEDVTNATAAMGNFIVQSMGAADDGGINIVVTGDSGPITLTGDSDLLTPDHGDLVVTNDNSAAAIAIGGNLEGAITIPGQVYSNDDDADILIGIAVDANNDGDWNDTDETPSGSVNANITIADAPETQILVANDINADIVVAGADQDPEYWGLELVGDLDGVKCGGTFGALGVNVLMVAGDIEDIVSDGAINSGIFVGGYDGDGYMWIEAVGINGPAVLGANYGVGDVDIAVHQAFGDEGRENEIYLNDGSSMVVQWAAGAITPTVMTLGDVYIFGSVSTLDVYSYTGDVMNIGDIFLLDDGSINIASMSSIGVVVAADDVTSIPTSETMQDQISTTYDVVYSPTDLDDASGDNEDLVNFDGTITATVAGGVIAEGDVDVTSNIAGAFGYIVALNGGVDGDVHSGTSIGSIVASTEVTGEFISEGELANSLGTLEADMTAWGLTGVPSWFLDTAGGVLVEAGDIYDAMFIASGDAILTPGGDAIFAERVMGTFYVVAGDIEDDVDIYCGGSMGGLQVPTGEAEMDLNVSMDGTIDRIIVAQWSPGGQSSYNLARVRLFVEAGEGDVIVVPSNPLDNAVFGVSVTGDSTVAIVSGDDITLVDGLAAGATLDVSNDMGDLDVNGDWAGTVNVDGTIEDIAVSGDVLATADLNADGYSSIDVEGTIDPSLVGGGTLSRTNRTDTLTMLNGTTTIYLKGPNSATAVYSSVFGQVNDVVFQGKGSVDFAVVNGNQSEDQMKTIVKNAKKGIVLADGSANVGDLSVLGTAITLKNVVVQGDLSSLQSQKNIGSLTVSGDVGTVTTCNAINKAFISGDVYELTARMVKNAVVQGDVDYFNAWKVQKTNVWGTTDILTITGNRPRETRGSIINSVFAWVNDTNFDLTYPNSNVRIVKSVIGGDMEEVQENPVIEQNFYGYGS